MAKKKKRPRQPPSGPASPPRGGANLERRDRKEEARRLREAERRRARRAASLRRTLTSAGIAIAAVAAISLFRSFQGPNDIPEAAVLAASEAGCTVPEQRPDLTPSQRHLTPGETITYPDPPATSGKHNGSQPPDVPKVSDTPVDETLAVHAMEHGAVFIHFLPAADGGLPQDVVDRLAEIATGSNATFLTPYPALTPETALTLTAWNYRQACPVSTTGTALTPADETALTPAAAATIVNGFVTGFECTGDAPENGLSPC
jgi:Protein of unknown function (DUF3105)